MLDVFVRVFSLIVMIHSCTRTRSLPVFFPLITYNLRTADRLVGHIYSQDPSQVYPNASGVIQASNGLVFCYHLDVLIQQCDIVVVCVRAFF